MFSFLLTYLLAVFNGGYVCSCMQIILVVNLLWDELQVLLVKNVLRLIFLCNNYYCVFCWQSQVYLHHILRQLLRRKSVSISSFSHMKHTDRCYFFPGDQLFRNLLNSRSDKKISLNTIRNSLVVQESRRNLWVLFILLKYELWYWYASI